MAKRRRSTRRAAPRRSYSRSPRRRGRRSKLNASTKKPLAGLGLAAGAATVIVPVAYSALKNKSITPVTAAVMSLDTWKVGVMRSAAGYVGGYVAGMVIDHTPLKKPVNKGLKMVGMR